MAGARVRRIAGRAGAVLVLGLAALAGACAPHEGTGVAALSAQAGQVVDVDAETRTLMEEHYVGCGSLTWVMTGGSPPDVNAADSAAFLVAEVSPGKVLVGYFNADQTRAIKYTDRTGAVKQVKVLLPNGVSLLPDANMDARVWQDA